MSSEQDAYESLEKQARDNTVTREQLLSWFKEELDRRDKEIEKLKRDNQVLFRTALKANDREVDKHVP